MTASASEAREITLVVNGERTVALIEPRLLLLDFLRDSLGLGGTHAGCEHGACGACTVLLDEQPIRSCLMFAVQARNHSLTTIEGLSDGDTLHPIQEAFSEFHALQCGFCTPGMILTALAFLRENPLPSTDEIRHGLAGNVCRCTGYVNIVKAVKAIGDRRALT